MAKQYQTNAFPNIVREYLQHLFLSELYKIPGSEKLLFKGGTALRIVYGSPRFSEDLDFSLYGIESHRQQKFIEDVFSAVLAAIERVGIKMELGKKFGPTRDGYYGEVVFTMSDYQPVSIAINISSRNGKVVNGEIDSVPNDFNPTYNVLHLPQREIVEEKVFGALMARKKARDFYDLYYILRKGLLDQEQKKRLAEAKDAIIERAGEVNFSELSVFLPADQQTIAKNFNETLLRELTRQLAAI
ncbi:hypothetical protein A2704_04070 [Candidatus Kaiserbacteria bacterium RIFCSPHIGHO2_01_FULL_54_36b]|nr:MAG: hypothetical protein A2704_04070 [Candidatus Kaiserbacteria bacterium RIFCSPHIGHO2_01_FULL_54_36b]